MISQQTCTVLSVYMYVTHGVCVFAVSGGTEQRVSERKVAGGLQRLISFYYTHHTSVKIV